MDHTLNQVNPTYSYHCMLYMFLLFLMKGPLSSLTYTVAQLSFYSNAFYQHPLHFPDTEHLISGVLQLGVRLGSA